MPFTYLDEPKKKSKFTYIDDNSPVDNQNSLTKTLSSSAKQQPSGDPVIDALTFAQKEIVGPIAQGVNTAAFGIPRAITKAVAGDEFAKQAFAQQSTGLGKVARFGSEATGLIAGGTGQIANQITKRMIPKVGAKLGQKIIGNAVAGGVSSATVSPEDFTDFKSRGINAITGAAGGAVLPIAGAVANKIPLGVKSIGDFANKTGRTITRIKSRMKPNNIENANIPIQSRLDKAIFSYKK
jgi:hypothetical protein